jgi:hypothetical protein
MKTVPGRALALALILGSMVVGDVDPIPTSAATPGDVVHSPPVTHSAPTSGGRLQPSRLPHPTGASVDEPRTPADRPHLPRGPPGLSAGPIVARRAADPGPPHCRRPADPQPRRRRARPARRCHGEHRVLLGVDAGELPGADVPVRPSHALERNRGPDLRLRRPQHRRDQRADRATGHHPQRVPLVRRWRSVGI